MKHVSIRDSDRNRTEGLLFLSRSCIIQTFCTAQLFDAHFLTVPVFSSSFYDNLFVFLWMGLFLFFFFFMIFFLSFCFYSFFFFLSFFLSFFQPDVCENSVSVSLQGDSSLLAEATLIPPTPEKRGGQVFLSPSLCIHLFLCPFISSFILLAGLLYPFRYVFPPHHPSMWSPTPGLWWFLCAAAWFAF